MQSQVGITDSVFDAGPKEFVFGRFDGSNEPSGMEKKLYEKKKKKTGDGGSSSKWRCWASIPAPLACYASALPSKLHCLNFLVITNFLYYKFSFPYKQLAHINQHSSRDKRNPIEWTQNS